MLWLQIILGGFVGGMLPPAGLLYTKLQNGGHIPDYIVLMFIISGFLGSVVALMTNSSTLQQAIVSGIGAPGIIAGVLAGNAPLSNVAPNKVSSINPAIILSGNFRNTVNSLFPKAYAQSIAPAVSSQKPALRLLKIEAAIPPEDEILSNYQMILRANALNFTQSFPLGNTVRLSLPDQVINAEFVAGDFISPFQIQTGGMTACITDIDVGRGRQLLSKFGFPLELYPDSFKVTTYPDDTHVCQDPSLNEKIHVSVQWNAARHDQQPVALSALVTILQKAGFISPGYEKKPIISRWEGTLRLIVYYYPEDRMAAAKLVETANDWLRVFSLEGPLFVASDQSSLVASPGTSFPPLHHISLQVWYQ